MRPLVLFALVTASFLCAQQTAPAPQTTKTAKIEEIFRLTKTDQLQKQIMTQMAAMMKQQAGTTNDASQKVMDFVAKKMSWDTMKPDFIKLYDDTYTEEEISGILLFYQSPPGQAMLAKSPVLMTNTMALVQKRMAEVTPEIQKMVKENSGK